VKTKMSRPDRSMWRAVQRCRREVLAARGQPCWAGGYEQATLLASGDPAFSTMP
jgi:hypothetical protein